MRALILSIFLLAQLSFVKAENIDYFTYDIKIYEELGSLSEVENYIKSNPGTTFTDINNIPKFNGLLSNQAPSHNINPTPDFTMIGSYCIGIDPVCYGVGSAISVLIVIGYYVLIILLI